MRKIFSKRYFQVFLRFFWFEWHMCYRHGSMFWKYVRLLVTWSPRSELRDGCLACWTPERQGVGSLLLLACSSGGRLATAVISMTLNHGSRLTAYGDWERGHSLKSADCGFGEQSGSFWVAHTCAGCEWEGNDSVGKPST